MFKQQKEDSPTMYKYLKDSLLIMFLFLIPMDLFAQQDSFNEQDFFNRIKTSYYNLSDTGLQNFTALVTNEQMQVFASEAWDNSEIFPLQLIWFNPDKLYLSQHGTPKLEENKYLEYQEIVNGLKTQLRGILLDLQRFYLRGLYDSIGPDYVLQHNEEAVQINFINKDQSGETRIKYLFGYNGLNVLIQLEYPQQKKQIVIYPKFKTVKNKWLCTGWSVQTYLKDEIINGYNLTIQNKFVNDLWVPGEILIEVQKSEIKGQKYYDQIILRNYLFNQSIKLQKHPSPGTP